MLLEEVGGFAAAQHDDGTIFAIYEDIHKTSVGKGIVRLLQRKGGHWSRHAIDPEGPAGKYLAVAIDSKGNPLVAYYAANIRGLKIFDGSVKP